jgi:hypothetical protein
MFNIKNVVYLQFYHFISILIYFNLKGKKIQATIPAQCVDLFSNVLYEDSVYMIAFFHVKDNLIPSMTTLNQFRLLFCSTTTVIPSHSFSIGYYSLMLFHSEKISNYRYGLSYLIGMSTEHILYFLYCHLIF